MSYKIFRILYLSIGAVFLVAALVLGGVLYFTGKLFLMPGPLSEMAARGEPIDGYSNHSEFEQSCGHCHTPVHCITDSGCQDCHMDVAKQRSTGDGLHARLPGTSRCQNCHIEHKGREVVLTDFAFTNIDHASMSGFNLDKHQQDYDGSFLGCESCHSQSRFVSDTLDCVTCHSQEDHDYIAGHIETYGLDCIACHDGADTMVAFDHDEIYPLDGGHADAPCTDCHTELAFEDTPDRCQDCHDKTLPYASMFGSDCQRCHTTTAWAPALLTQHTFSLSHGSEEQLACESCHVGEYAVKSCYECHDHQPDQMLVAHLSEQVYVIDRCEECHPTGVSGEAERLRAQWEPVRAAEAAWIDKASLFSGWAMVSSPPTPLEPEEIASTPDQLRAIQFAADNWSMSFEQTTLETEEGDRTHGNGSPMGPGEAQAAGPDGEVRQDTQQPVQDSVSAAEEPSAGVAKDNEAGHGHRMPH